MSSLTTGNITDQPCECEKCAGIRRHDVGLRSDNWIMTPESRQQQPDTPDSLESHSLCSVHAAAWRPCSLQGATMAKCLRHKKMQLTPSPGDTGDTGDTGEVTCHHPAPRHVTAHLRVS